MSASHVTSALVILAVATAGAMTQTQGCDGNVVLTLLVPQLSSLLPPSTQPGSDDSAGHDLNDDNGVDGPGHDLNDDNGGQNAGGDTTLLATRLARMEAGGIEAEVVFEKFSARSKLKVEVNHAAAGQTFAVIIAGVDVGTLTADSLGKAEVEFDTKVEPNHVAWPTELSTDLPVGTTVAVGALEGQLNSGVTPPASTTPPGGTAPLGKLSAAMKAGGVESQVVYEKLTGRSKLEVEVNHAAAGQQFVVTIAGVDVGTLTADALGRAKVEFDTKVEAGHTAWPAGLSTELSGGATVRVGALAGALGSV